MDKVAQVFRNFTTKPIYIGLEMSAARYCLEPGKELILNYEAKPVVSNPHKAALIVDYRDYEGGIGMVVHTDEDQMTETNGQPAEMKFD